MSDTPRELTPEEYIQHQQEVIADLTDYYEECDLLQYMWRKRYAKAEAEIARLRAELEQATAQAAAMREALEAVDRFIINGIICGYIRMPDPELNDPASKVPEMVREALSSDAGAALLEELKKLREFVGAVNYMVESMPEGMNHYCDVLRKPLAELYAKEGDHE